MRLPILESMTRLAVLALLVPCTLVAAEDQLPPIRNLSEPEPGLVAAGQPTEEQLQALAQAGFATVIDLRTEGEDRGFDEPAVAEQAGLAYLSIPVSRDSLSDSATYDRFVASLEEAQRPILLHCGSSTRVGGLYLAYLVLEKEIPWDEALERAQAAGLHSPEWTERVRTFIESQR